MKSIVISIIFILFSLQLLHAQRAAKLTIQRNYRVLGAFQKVKIKVNNKPLKIANASRMTIIITDDNIKIEGKILRKNSLQFKAEPGIHYMVEMKIAGLFGIKPKFQIVKQLEIE